MNNNNAKAVKPTNEEMLVNSVLLLLVKENYGELNISTMLNGIVLLSDDLDIVEKPSYKDMLVSIMGFTKSDIYNEKLKLLESFNYIFTLWDTKFLFEPAKIKDSSNGISIYNEVNENPITLETPLKEFLNPIGRFKSGRYFNLSALFITDDKQPFENLYLLFKPDIFDLKPTQKNKSGIFIFNASTNRFISDNFILNNEIDNLEISLKANDKDIGLLVKTLNGFDIETFTFLNPDSILDILELILKLSKFI